MVFVICIFKIKTEVHTYVVLFAFAFLSRDFKLCHGVEFVGAVRNFSAPFYFN